MTTTVPASMVDADVATQAELDAVSAAISGKANDASVVHNTGDETVAGIKTFTSQPIRPQDPVLRTAVATTSGTAVDFTSIPSWVRRITIALNGVSMSGTAYPIVQIGSGSLVTTGYVGSVSTIAATVASISPTNGFGCANSVAAANAISGLITLINIGNNIWVEQGVTGISTGAATHVSGGSLALAGALDRLRFTTSNGTDTFDAGSVNVFYE